MLKRILVAVIFVPILFVILFFLPPIWLTILVAFITAAASYELLRATRVAHHNRMYAYTALAAGLIPFGYYLGHAPWTLIALSLLLMAALFYLVITLLLTFAFNYLDKRLSISEQGIK